MPMGVALRGSFVFDPDGKLCAYEIHNNAIGRNMEELLHKVQAAAFVRENGGIEVCPAGWKPGEKTLKPGLDLVGENLIREGLMASKSRKSFAVIVGIMLLLCMGCVPKATKNALSQNTGEAGSTVPRSHPPYYANTAGNIVAPPGNPAGNPAGSPLIINGTENSSSGWPAGR